MRIILALVIAAAGARADPIAVDTAAAPVTPRSNIGVSLALGGGLSGFAGSEMKDITNVGGAWEVRVAFGTRLLLAGELAYVGTRRNMHLTGVSGATPGETPHVFSNAIEGDLRAQYPFLSGAWLIEPFAFGGLGYTHMGVDATVPTDSRIRTTGDDLLVVPFGAGVIAGWNRVLLEARFTWRQAFDEDLLARADGSIASLSNWSAGATVGYEF